MSKAACGVGQQQALQEQHFQAEFRLHTQALKALMNRPCARQAHRRLCLHGKMDSWKAGVTCKTRALDCQPRLLLLELFEALKVSVAK